MALFVGRAYQYTVHYYGIVSWKHLAGPFAAALSEPALTAQPILFAP